MRAVLFLGAGFSAPFGNPTMNQFMGYAAQNLDSEKQQFLSSLALEAARANRMLESSPTNLEDILSFAVMGDRLRLYGEDGQERSPPLRKILQHIYSRIEYPEGYTRSYWGRFDVLKRFLSQFSLDLQSDVAAVVTTNYDLNAESAINFLGGQAELPFEYDLLELPEKWQRDQGRTLYQGPLPEGMRRVKDGTLLYKLHGSVSWFASRDGGDKPVVADASIRIQSFQAKREDSSIPAVCLHDEKLKVVEHDPLIVPPTFLKPDVSSALAKSWEGAAQAMSRAERLIFVGYSFPPTDVEMKYFLASALSDNVALRRIYVVDPYAEAIVERLRNADSGFGSHFKHLLEPIQSDWTKHAGPSWNVI